MIILIMMRITTHNAFSDSPAGFGMLADMGDETVMEVPVEFWTNLPLTNDVIGGSFGVMVGIDADMFIGGSFGVMVGIDADMFIGMFLIAVDTGISLMVLVTVSHAMDADSGLCERTVCGTDIAIDMLVVMLVTKVIASVALDAVVFAWVDTDAGEVRKTDLEFMPMLTPPDEALPFGWGACSCWPTTV